MELSKLAIIVDKFPVTDANLTKKLCCILSSFYFYDINYCRLLWNPDRNNARQSNEQVDPVLAHVSCEPGKSSASVHPHGDLEPIF